MKIRIEDVSKELINKADAKDLRNLRLRFIQMWEKICEVSPGTKMNGIERNDFLKKYDVVMTEFEKRSLEFRPHSLDHFQLRKRLLGGLDPAFFGDIVLRENFISTVGDFIKNPKGTGSIPLLVSGNEAENFQLHEEKVSKKLEEQIGKTVEFGYFIDGPHQEYIPLYDLVLRPRAILVKINASQQDDITEMPADEVELIGKPFRTESSCRISPPSDFMSGEGNWGRGTRESGGKTYSVIYGKPKNGNSGWQQQAFRYKVDIWDEGAARSHCERHKGTFEPAVPERKKVDKAIEFTIAKIDASEHLVGGVVYEPDVEDAQGDFADAETIRKAMLNYMADFQTIKIMHSGRPLDNCKIVECYITPVDMEINKRQIRKGSWWITIKIFDDEIWKDVKSGDLTGFSMSGSAETE